MAHLHASRDKHHQLLRRAATRPRREFRLSAFIARERPGFIGYPDRGAYVIDAVNPGTVHFDPLRIIGNGWFLRQMQAINDELFTVMALQDAFGRVGFQRFLYCTLRRGRPAVKGLKELAHAMH